MSESKKYTYKQYVEMSVKFNGMPFKQKIQTLMNNKDILRLGGDGNCWGVRVVDDAINEKLFDENNEFVIENEWRSERICDLLGLLGIDVYDY